jgi:hypothetical protein
MTSSTLGERSFDRVHGAYIAGKGDRAHSVASGGSLRLGAHSLQFGLMGAREHPRWYSPCAFTKHHAKAPGPPLPPSPARCVGRLSGLLRAPTSRQGAPSLALALAVALHFSAGEFKFQKFSIIISWPMLTSTSLAVTHLGSPASGVTRVHCCVRSHLS